MKFTETPLLEVVDFLEEQGRLLDPEGKSVPIVLHTLRTKSIIPEDTLS
jgi:hypothetical protein